MSAGGNYTAAETVGYEPPPCPDCGSTNVLVDWLDITTFGDAEKQYIPGRMRCLDCRNLQQR